MEGEFHQCDLDLNLKDGSIIAQLHHTNSDHHVFRITIECLVYLSVLCIMIITLHMAPFPNYSTNLYFELGSFSKNSI